MYTVPDQWAHGDEPTAAKVNKWKDSLDAIHATAGDRAINVPCKIDAAGTDYYFIHRHRYLYFLADAGIIHDPSGVGDDVNIASSDGFEVYDLDSIGWLQYGALYYIEECNAAMEHWIG